MAGDWIPIRKNLHQTREILQISQRTGKPVFYVVGVILKFWAWIDDECVDGLLSGLQPDILPTAVGETEEFWDAVIDAGWLLVEAGVGMRIPNHNRWVSRSAKQRLLDARRKRTSRTSEQDEKFATRPVANRTNVRLQTGQKPDQRKEKERIVITDTVRAVFDYWRGRCNHHGAILDNKRAALISKQLEAGRSLEELKLAIDGAAADPFSQGANDRGRKFDDISLICRDASHIEQFIEMAQAAKNGHNKTRDDFYDRFQFGEEART